VVELVPDEAEPRFQLCWHLAVQRRAREALTQCEQAIARDDVPYYHDGRGLARAQLGNLAGAAADFKLFADWTAQEYPEEEQVIAERRAWIAALERGENPITPEVLAGLR
jgi:hypothetical protein